MKTMKNLTVVIPVSTDMRVVRAIGSVDRSLAEILVVLNGASEQVHHAVLDSGVRVIELPNANGPMACEVGYRNATTPYVVFLDSDCVFKKGSLESYLGAIGKADLIRGIMVYAYNDRFQKIVSYFRSIWANNGPYISKPSLMVKVGVENKIGGYLFDSRLSWTEDFDLSIRVKRAGDVSVAQVKNAKVVHDAMTMRNDLRSTFYYGVGHYQGYKLSLFGYAPITLRRVLSRPSKLIRCDDKFAPWYFLLQNFVLWVGFQWSKICRLKPENLKVSEMPDE